MTFRKKECPRPRIRGDRQKRVRQPSFNKYGYAREYGQIEWMASLFFLLFLGILLCACMQVSAYRASSLYLEDALAASNLASAVIDLEEYGRTHVITVADPQEAYVRFCAAVQGNLQLNEAWECSNKALISGKVSVESYIVYNVKKDVVTVYEVKNNGGVHSWQGSLGSVMAPNGKYVESTSIYSELAFPIEGLFGVMVNAHKGQLVDIVADGAEETQIEKESVE